jgi:rhodanese-related sulfurtransferase
MAFENLTVREAYAMQRQGYTYVDVRSIPEFEDGHPADAVNVPLLHHDERTGQIMPNREFLDVIRANFAPDAKLLIGCQVGGRSAQAAHALTLAGFEDVANVLGGFAGAQDPMTGAVHAEGWLQAALPVETGRAEGRGYEDLRARVAQQGPLAE